MGDDCDNASSVESGFTAGSCDAAAERMMCALLKLTTASWKDLMKRVGQEWVHLEHKEKLDVFQELDETGCDFEWHHLRIVREATFC